MSALAITATAVLSSGLSAGAQIQQVTLGAGVTVTQGQVLYKDVATGTYGLCDANLSLAASKGAGIALAAGSPGQVINMVTYDPAFTVGGTLTVGATLWTSATAGGVTITAADNTTGVFVQVIGVAISTTQASIAFPPNGGFQSLVVIP